MRGDELFDVAARSAHQCVARRGRCRAERSASGLFIVSGGTVVTVDGARNIYDPGAVAIDGTTIVAVGPAADIAARFKAAEVIQAAGSIVIPGLINAHTHAPMVLYRGLADDLRLQEWLEKYIFPAEAKTVSREMVRAGTRLAALEMIQSGTTVYADMYYFEEEIARTTKAAGMRGVLGQTIIQFPVPDAKTPQEGLARTEAFFKEFANDDLIVPAVAPHSPYTLDSKTLLASRALAAKYGAPVLIHVAETETELGSSKKDHAGLTPVGYLQSIGVLRPAHPRQSWRVGRCRRHEDPERPRGCCFTQSGKQHEACERHRSCTRISRERHHCRAGHRWGRQQQRPRHVRGDAFCGVAAQGENGRSPGRAGHDGAGNGHHQWREGAGAGQTRWLARSGKRADLGDRVDGQCSA